MRVIDVMTTDVVTVVPEDSLKDAARKMVNNRVSGLPVVSDGRLAGMVTEADFLQKEVEREHPAAQRLLAAVFGGEEPHDEAITVAEVMATTVATIEPEATLSEAARVMASKGFKRLPVIDSDGTLLGVVSRADIVNAFTRPDEVIEDEIREDVARRVLFVEPDSFSVVVEEGVVKLSGEMPTRTDARLLHELTRRLDGVVAVEDELTWKVDDQKIERGTV